MASVEEFGAAVAAVSGKLDETLAALGAATVAGTELADALQSASVDGRATQARAVVSDIEGEAGHTAAVKQRIGSIRAAVEALGGLLTAMAGTGSGPMPGSAVSAVRSAPAGWPSRPAGNGRGRVWQRPGAEGNADMVRVMAPTRRYPHGYLRFYNEHGQPIGSDGKPGSRAQTHIPVAADGSHETPRGWHHG